MKSIILSAAFIFLNATLLPAQEDAAVSLSLQQCVQIAVERNINVQIARINKEKSAYKISETRAALLPQVSLGGSFLDYFKIPVTILSGDLIGQPGTTMPLEMSVKYNTSANVSLNQVLYNQTALTALKLSKKSDDLNRLGIEKASEAMAQEVAKLYFLALTSAEQKSLIEQNIQRTQKMTDITKTLVDNGMGKKVDYERISVSLENLYTQLSNTEALHEQQLNLIKYMLEIPTSQSILLTDSAAMRLLPAEPVSMDDFSNHTDIQILESQKELAKLNQKMINDGYLPSLSLTGQYAYSGMRTGFKNYFNNSPENKWYGSSYIGINLSIPIFDGMEKRSKSRQAKLEYQKSTLTLDDTKEKFSVDYKNAMNNYYNNKSNVERQQQNINLAEKVYTETALRYREGLSTMSDLLQDEIGLSDAQSSYMNALYNLKDAELNIMSLNGEIKNLYNK